ADTIMADLDDAYLNYRFGLQQRGFYTPFEANIFLNETAAWMDEQIDQGLHIRSTDPRWSMWVQEFNQAPVMMERRRRFAVVSDGPFVQIIEHDRGPGGH